MLLALSMTPSGLCLQGLLLLLIRLSLPSAQATGVLANLTVVKISSVCGFATKQN